MNMKKYVLFLGILLTACSNPSVKDSEIVSSSHEKTLSSSATEIVTSESQQPIPLEKALDRTFSSTKLGVSFPYPSVVYQVECDTQIPVTVREIETGIEFLQEWGVDEECGRIPGGLFSVIHIQRASDTTDVRRFIDKVFSTNCTISEKSEYEESGHELVRFFLQSKNPPKDEPDFACGESIIWNKTIGIVLFSNLGSKTGGGIDWPSKRPILMPDGSVERAFDFPIMKSIQFQTDAQGYAQPVSIAINNECLKIEHGENEV